jgi:hypothetical protein
MHEQGLICVASDELTVSHIHASTVSCNVRLFVWICAGAGAGRVGHAWSKPERHKQGLRPAPAGGEPEMHHLDGQVTATRAVVEFVVLINKIGGVAEK